MSKVPDNAANGRLFFDLTTAVASMTRVAGELAKTIQQVDLYDENGALRNPLTEPTTAEVSTRVSLTSYLYGAIQAIHNAHVVARGAIAAIAEQFPTLEAASEVTQ